MQDRFWYRFRNWFRTKPGPGEPLRFLCGSEAELRRVTTWMCHSLSACFEDAIPCISIYYQAAHPDTAGKATASLQLGGRRKPIIEETKWLPLILKYNQFTGTRWVQVYSHSNPSFKKQFAELPAVVQVKFHPPSAHERAESLLSLSEWLDGKVSEEEKRHLLHLPDDMEI